MQGTPLKFRVIVAPPEDQSIISLILRDVRDSVLFELFDPQFSLSKVNRMNIVIDVNAGKLPLLAGLYTVDVWFGDRRGNHIDRIDGAIEFEVVAVGENDVGPPLVAGFGYTGSFYYPSKWTHISSTVGADQELL